MKKRDSIFAVALIGIMLAGSGSLAYFSSTKKAHNVITSGGIDIAIVEKTKQADGTLADFPKEGIHGLMPGSTASKIVSVQNTGKSEAWIRVKVESEIEDSKGEDLPLTLQDGKEVLSFSPKQNWKKEADGYYYFLTPVKGGESTSLFFEEVLLEKSAGNEYQNATANLNITAEAVQTANNGETPQKATGWPTAPAKQEG